MSGFVLFPFEIDVISFYFITIFVTACILYHTTTSVTWVRRPPSFKPFFFFLWVACSTHRIAITQLLLPVSRGKKGRR